MGNTVVKGKKLSQLEAKVNNKKKVAKNKKK